MSLTPVNSFLAVSLTPAINFRPFGYFWPVSTIKNLLPVSLTPLNSFSPVSFTPAINSNSQISPRIFEKIQNGPNGILMGLGDTWARKSRVRLPLRGRSAELAENLPSGPIHSGLSRTIRVAGSSWVTQIFNAWAVPELWRIFDSKLWWISSTYNKGFLVLLALQ